MEWSAHPRPSGRGPIEASIPSTRSPPLAAIRDLAVAAPLKLASSGLWRRSRGSIRDLAVAAPLKRNCGLRGQAGRPRHPRPSGRGPIEAFRETSAWPNSTTIRDLAVAAPLKRIAFDHIGLRRVSIRDLAVAAPLKLYPPLSGDLIAPPSAT